MALSKHEWVGRPVLQGHKQVIHMSKIGFPVGDERFGEVSARPVHAELITNPARRERLEQLKQIAQLLDSQFATLEEPTADEWPIIAPIEQSPRKIIEHILANMAQSGPWRG